MDVKAAVRAAKQYVAEIFADEGLFNLGLEEVEHDDVSGRWSVTVGFSRPWNTARDVLTAVSGEAAPRRSYKVVSISQNGDVTSVKRRDKLDA